MKILFFLFTLFCFSFGVSNKALSNKQVEYLENKKIIKMCVDPDWEPFEKINQEGNHEGIAADLIHLVERKINIKIKLVATKTWEESIEFSKAHKCDILSFLNETPKRQEWLVFSDVLFKDPNVIIGRAEREYITDLSSKKLSIALPIGTAMSERFAKDFPNLTIIPTTNENEAFQLVEQRKADLTVRSLIVAAYTIKKEGIFNLKIIGEPQGYENNLRIGVRKDEPILKDILNTAINQISQKEIDEIVNKHVSIRIEKVTNITIAIWVFVALVGIILVILLWNFLLNKKVKLAIEKNLLQESIIIEQKRKSEIGELLGNISHQWKNGLTQISSLNLEMILMHEMQNKSKNDPLYLRMQDTEKSIKFMTDTMKTFLDYYKGNNLMRYFKVEDNLGNVMKLFDLQIKKSGALIKIEQNFDLEVYANENEWYHIWLNLISNSLQAAENKNIKDIEISIKINEDTITYEDNCGGIENQVLNKIHQNLHNGLGLKMMKKILEKNSFIFEIHNIENGTKFIISKIK